MQIYHCKKCGFTFSRVGKVETCPDCGKPDIRPALEHEIAEFHSYQQEFERNRQQEERIGGKAKR